MITLAQIRAARALLDWKQDELAKASNLSLPSINNLERGLYSPRPETLDAIKSALEQAGIEFLENNGVAIRTDNYSIKTLKGPRFIADLDDDILSVLKTPEDELLAISQDERKWIDYSGVTNHKYVEARAARLWKERIIIPETASYLTSPAESYRTLPANEIPAGVIEIYGDRLALIEWQAMRVTIIQSVSIAESQRLLFNNLWKKAEPLNKKTLQSIERWSMKPVKKKKT